MQHRLVAIAVHQHQVIAGDHRVPDNLVGRGRAIDHEKGVIGAEIACCTGLGFSQGAGMIEQGAELRHRHRKIRAQGVFPEKLVKRLPDRTLVIRHPSAVTGGVPRVIGIRGVLHQRLEKRRQQAIEVFARGAGHLPGEKGHGVLKQIKNAAQLIELGHGVGGCVFQGHFFAQGEDRQIRCTHPRQTDQFGHVLQQMRMGAGVFRGNQHAGQAVVSRRHQSSFGVVHRRNDAEPFLLQLPGNPPHAVAGDAVGLDVAMDNQDREFQIFIHEAQCPEAADQSLPITSG
ncbi:hypothetical protein D3C78_919180 [compost metagenome]